ncbi:MAG: hypothetical protein M3Q90_03745 [Candidatus Dormibacteraeota bacterium]|nr:hypothetical protein [Candidatus Dormibacteraeota bacterium]
MATESVTAGPHVVQSWPARATHRLRTLVYHRTATHALLVFYVLALTPLFGELQGPLLTASLLALMLLIWAMVKRRFLFAVIPR